MLSKLKSFLESYHFLPEEQEWIMARFKTDYVKKKSYFLKAGEVANKMAFIEDGAFRYYVDNDGEEVTTFLLMDFNIITSISSYLRNKSCLENIQAITDSTVAVISKTDIDELRNKIPRFQELYLETIEYQVVCLDTNRTDLLTLTPKERYLKILERQPQLFSKIPLKLLASTLGITPRHLTRIRNTIIKD